MGQCKENYRKFRISKTGEKFDFISSENEKNSDNFLLHQKTNLDDEESQEVNVCASLELFEEVDWEKSGDVVLGGLYHIFLENQTRFKNQCVKMKFEKQERFSQQI